MISPSSRHFFNSYDAPITINKELRSKKDGGHTKHIEVDLEKARPLKKNAGKLEYVTADNCGVCPINDSEIVSKVAEKFGFDLDQCFRLTVNKSADKKTQKAFKHIFPTPCTVGDCLRR